ncbi:MAG: hypothetical protein RXO54_07230, partial [Acidilobus sp.]
SVSGLIDLALKDVIARTHLPVREDQIKRNGNAVEITYNEADLKNAFLSYMDPNVAPRISAIFDVKIEGNMVKLIVRL